MALKSATTTAGTRIDDSSVTGRVKAALLADPEVKSFDISVATVDGTVQLSGFVDNQTRIDRAASIARDAEGSRLVNNELMIKH